MAVIPACPASNWCAGHPRHRDSQRPMIDHRRNGFAFVHFFGASVEFRPTLRKLRELRCACAGARQGNCSASRRWPLEATRAWPIGRDRAWTLRNDRPSPMTLSTTDPVFRTPASSNGRPSSMIPVDGTPVGSVSAGTSIRFAMRVFLSASRFSAVWYSLSSRIRFLFGGSIGLVGARTASNPETARRNSPLNSRSLIQAFT